MTAAITQLARKELVVLGCSATKVEVGGMLPAISRYDGPTFRVLRSFLRDYRWPDALSVAVLSAKYGIIGGLSHIQNYDQRMTPLRAAELAGSVTQTLQGWSSSHWRMNLVVGQDYLYSIDPSLLTSLRSEVQVVEGSIGVKLHRLHDLLREVGQSRRLRPRELPQRLRPLYFLPDWDDFIDVDYDFEHDVFSSADRSARHEEHSIALMRPQRLCDGVLVSLAQNLGTKGLLRRVGIADENSLAPRPVREHFRLRADQWAFGDCGAFSYVNEAAPTISVEQAVSLYDLYGFDLCASVDHIPVSEVQTDKGKKTLTKEERADRVKLTHDNAEHFLRVHRDRGACFIPVGVIQGIHSADYSQQIGDYMEMGYRHIALGGLVPRSDAEVRAVVDAVADKMKKLRRPPWLHLLGIFRPSLQPHFRTLGIGSFDSATYFRKAWLRSEQNYLGADGRWYAAIRVPPLRDPRTMKRLQASGETDATLRRLEQRALGQLRNYDKGVTTLNAALEAVLEYDKLLARAELMDAKLIAAYSTTALSWPCSGRVDRRIYCPAAQLRRTTHGCTADSSLAAEAGPFSPSL